ncbi:SDR family NAD(P)-dependent oxidoreductase [Ketogulonicigenium vulgare]|uniref:Short-chain dehydrogenase/reductase family member n=1 Tax=Ketogulonicigenium vulgare (strain WSH-001) TaxID=759362 RepID=F9Y4C6_KETVW|nr:SDR family NAD(P)-dependent oxidoreductase [Ketogulonicigenium vulgare]ADO43457.1 short-chain dehydrogenase/reductase SDR [Ketogulonicigenium vulgare Y25]AEM41739.1 Short-chain dehydrogenase/reductase family member [Ketogulonicigenium vulgare WSH-001]ALJ81847.1 short-chain dehydrogenase [Ketogulonicigenium vulgare]ANW34501.1 short-chain dehydrogenase [Ketogulonicigenium vulgare]AOZ55493.1 short-chain dehydrogenase/reductase SDR [Ketogulonicigenium vulgare]
MRDWQGRTYWLIGASEGIGRELATLVSRAGAEVILSARNAERLEELAATLPGRARVLPMDVRDSAAVKAAAEAAGQVDGVIFMSGVMSLMRAAGGSAGWSFEAAEVMADTNFTGAVRVISAVLPQMCARGTGHIMLVASLAAYRGLPGMAVYGASKGGVMQMAEGLRAELQDTGILVQVVNPGFVDTQMTRETGLAMPLRLSAEQAAREMFEHMNTDTFRRGFPLAMSWSIRLARFLPDWLWMRLIR